jgi:hypothetical protein
VHADDAKTGCSEHVPAEVQADSTQNGHLGHLNGNVTALLQADVSKSLKTVKQTAVLHVEFESAMIRSERTTVQS